MVKYFRIVPVNHWIASPIEVPGIGTALITAEFNWLKRGNVLGCGSNVAVTKLLNGTEGYHLLLSHNTLLKLSGDKRLSRVLLGK